MAYHCDNERCSSWSDRPTPEGWLFVRQIPLIVGAEQSLTFCCWQCMTYHAYAEQRPLL